MKKEYAEYLINKTKDDYNLISEDFSRTRNYLPEDIKSFGKYVKDGDKVLDLGCGNGRLAELFFNKKAEYIGVDNSEKLIEIAKKRYPQCKFIASSAFNLPFSDNYFDEIFSLAVFHHIPSQEFRLQFLSEAKRVLKPGGLLILTVWNLNPIQSIIIGEWERARSFFKYLILKIFGQTKLDFKDFFVPWRKDCQRYVHYFSKGELKKLAEKSGFKIEKIKISKTEARKETNLGLVARKNLTK
ncbi:MAG: class I SAM-dependent methyltransferase [Candidatus Pacebacteria bacterium]|nr:class I SAM-dependent methyltransferase [Candidatus Paceibacterota bacterium]